MGIKYARQMYERLQKKRKSLQMHFTMAEIEKNLGMDNAENIRVCYENALKQFGNLAEVGSVNRTGISLLPQNFKKFLKNNDYFL